MRRHYAVVGGRLIPLAGMIGKTHGDLQRAALALGADEYAIYFPEGVVEWSIYACNMPAGAHWHYEAGKWWHCLWGDATKDAAARLDALIATAHMVEV